MNRKLILVRHAKTTAANNTLVGLGDIPLSQQGIEDARRLHEGVDSESQHVNYYSSKLNRAIQTAEIVFPKAAFVLHSEINEIDFGQWSGMDIQEVSKNYPEAMEEWMREPLKFTFPGGDCVIDFIARIDDFLNLEILPKKDPCVLVCHGGVIRFIICRMIRLEYTHHLAFSVRRPSLNLIDHDGNSGVLAGLNLNQLRI